ncbi:hypothetical protein LTR36_002050 [Oleoguttula mirabilis]|uniref:SnoaL-like domain-containing protein n=1 Tax=Oleoguttula mirabilis TaxID=1507867 RepID=A0AAV9JLZ6_9PEZI|nr:hypothetical protein LTR36_002050 [Oleoguttula mirabilis]
MPGPEGITSHPSLAFLRPCGALSEKPQDGYHTNATAAYLESLSQTLLYLLTNDKDISNPLLEKHLSPDFHSHKIDTAPFKGRAQHLSLWQREVGQVPNLRCEIISCAAKVHEDGRKAKVWTAKRLSGLPGDICKEGVSIMKWERKGGVWMCVKWKMMRGVAEFE